jgi:hypothetical protein
MTQGISNDKFKKRNLAIYLEAKDQYQVSHKQWLFCMKYVGEAELMGPKAAALSYGKADGLVSDGGSMDLNMAGSIAYQNLKKPNVLALLQDLMGQVSMTSNEVLHRISTIARANFSDLVDIDDVGKPVLNLRKASKAGAMLLIKKMNLDSYGNLKSIELHDAFAALTKMGQHHKVFDRNRETAIEPRDLARELLDDLRAKHEDIPDHMLISKVLERFSGSGVTESDLIEQASDMNN